MGRTRRELMGGAPGMDSREFSLWLAFWKYVGGWGPERDDDRSVMHTAVIAQSFGREFKKGVGFLYPLARQREAVMEAERRERLANLISHLKANHPEAPEE